MYHQIVGISNGFLQTLENKKILINDYCKTLVSFFWSIQNYMDFINFMQDLCRHNVNLLIKKA